MKSKTSSQRGIYIHIPLCDYKCPYCNYEEAMIHNQKYVNRYVDSLLLEIDNLQLKGDITTIYIGGGNPNSLSDANLKKVLSAITKKVDLTLVEEYTIEAKPSDLKLERIDVLKKYGVNRISMPTQVVDLNIREKIGLQYNEETVRLAVNNLKKSGITNISADLIFPIPSKNNYIKNSIDNNIAYGINHMSCYPIENFLYDCEEDQEQHYKEIISYLNKRNYKQYDLLNFSSVGYENIHNSNYWRRKEYYAIGAGASGYIDGIRYSNIRDINEYIRKIESEADVIQDMEKLSIIDSVEEEFFLGLQLLSGIDLLEIEEKYSVDVLKNYDRVIQKHVLEGNLVFENNILKFSLKGILKSDDVLSDFILDDM